MTKTPAFACGIISLVGLLGAQAVLADEAPTDSSDRAALRQMARVVARESERVTRPHSTLVGYYPTLRYYGKDYTINYGFVTLNRGSYRKLTEPNPMILPVEHPVQRDDARVLTSTSASTTHKASGPTFRATRKLSPADTESSSEATTAAAAPAPAASASAAAAATIPLQPALPAPAK